MIVPEIETSVTREGGGLFRTTVRPREYVIGREPDADIWVEAELVSPRHAPAGVNARPWQLNALRCLVALLLCSLAMFPMRLTAQVSGQAHESLSELDAVITALLTAERIPGATVAASKGGRLIFDKAYGKRNVRTGEPMTTGTRCRIGSTGEILTALGIMKLTEQFPGFSTKTPLYGPGGILDEPSWQTIPAGPGMTEEEVRQDRERASRIRIDHLLSHTSGFTGRRDIEGAASFFHVPVAELTYEQVHAQFRRTHHIKFDPGLDRDDCGENPSVGTLVIERMAKVPYWTFIRDQIAAPIGLSNTWPTGKAPSGIDSAPHRYVSKRPAVWDDHKADNPLGTGDWVSTAHDLVRLMCATDKLPNQSDVLKPATLDLMESRPYFFGAPDKAHGWQYEPPRGKVWHSGWIGTGASYIAKYPPGYVSFARVDLSNVNMAICVNIGKDTGALHDALSKIANAVGKANIPPSYDLFRDGLANP